MKKMTLEEVRSARESLLKLGLIRQVISFSGAFRLPFSQVDPMGFKRDYYLAADGTPTPVRQHERDLGFPLVRLEVTFGP